MEATVRDDQQPGLLLHTSTEEGWEVSRHTGAIATPEGHSMWAFLTANEGAREASSPSPPVRSLLLVLSSQNNKGKPRASKESFDRLVNVFQTGRSVPLHKNHFFLNHLTVQLLPLEMIYFFFN